MDAVVRCQVIYGGHQSWNPRLERCWLNDCCVGLLRPERGFGGLVRWELGWHKSTGANRAKSTQGGTCMADRSRALSPGIPFSSGANQLKVARFYVLVSYHHLVGNYLVVNRMLGQIQIWKQLLMASWQFNFLKGKRLRDKRTGEFHRNKIVSTNQKLHELIQNNQS